MDFKVGHLLFMTKNVKSDICEAILRVISTSFSSIQAIEYTSNLTFGMNDNSPKTFTYQDDNWYTWGNHGGVKVYLKKIGLIDPTKTVVPVQDFLDIRSDTLIIKGSAYKVLGLNSNNFSDTITYQLKGKVDATLIIKKLVRESLHEASSSAELIVNNVKTRLLPAHVWVIKLVGVDNMSEDIIEE